MFWELKMILHVWVIEKMRKHAYLSVLILKVAVFDWPCLLLALPWLSDIRAAGIILE